MDQNQQSIFGLSIDDTNRAHLSEAAKWGRFLAIVGFVVCVLIVLVGLYATFAFSAAESQLSDFPSQYRSRSFALDLVLEWRFFISLLQLFTFFRACSCSVFPML
jgi:hypothetical protein